MPAQSGTHPDALTLTVADGSPRPFSSEFTVDQNRLLLRVNLAGNYSNSGSWVKGLYDVYYDGVTGLLGESQVSLASVTAPYGGAASYPAGLDTLYVLPETAGNAIFTGIMSFNPLGPDPRAVANSWDPIWKPATTGGLVDQAYGITDNDFWPRYPGLFQSFNLDAMMQQAVWQRVWPLYPDPSVFFNGPGWEAFLAFGTLKMNVQMLQMSGPAVIPDDGAYEGGLPPYLTGYPIGPPTYKLSNRAVITFIGTANGSYNLLFAEPGSTPLPAAVPIYVAAPGTSVILDASGYRPGMQVAIEKPGAGQINRLELDATWQDYGRFSIQIPKTAKLATYKVKQYRFLISPIGGGAPSYSAWHNIPTAHRSKIIVQ
jgi:hypothetical protein